MRSRVTIPVFCALLLLGAGSVPAQAQSSGDIGVRGFAMFGNMSFTAKESFDAVLETSSGPIYGGGGQVLLPWGIYAEVGAWRFRQDGQRVFIGPNDELFRLGIPLQVTITPLEVTGGYRFPAIARRLVPYAGVGYSSYSYKETSEFSDPSENVNERFAGYHVQAGAEYQPFGWLAVGGEVSWSTIADALGEGGVSAAFGENNLGGTSARLKISVGR